MLCHVSDPWIIRAPDVNHWGVFFYFVRLSYNFNNWFILFPFWEIKNAWNALDISTKVKRSPVFHSDVFISSVLLRLSLWFPSSVQKREYFTLILPSTGVLQLISQCSCSFFWCFQSLCHLLLADPDQRFWCWSSMTWVKPPVSGWVLPLLCWLQALCATAFMREFSH